MSGDAAIIGEPSLSPRASIARLTLQLRAAVFEAEEAERAGAHEVDADAELRARLLPLLREREQALETELAHARAAAAKRVATVRDELERAGTSRAAAEAGRLDPPRISRAVAEFDDAATIVGEPRSSFAAEAGALAFAGAPAVAVGLMSSHAAGGDRAVHTSASVSAAAGSPTGEVDAAGWVMEAPTVAAESPATLGPVEAGLAAAGVDGPGGSEPPAPLTADDVRAIVDEALRRFAADQVATQRHVSSASGSVDPDALARTIAAAFAASLSTMADERMAALGSVSLYGPTWARHPNAAAPASVKKSFWTNMWHADVVLSLVAALIVLVVLIAWST